LGRQAARHSHLVEKNWQQMVKKPNLLMLLFVAGSVDYPAGGGAAGPTTQNHDWQGKTMAGD